MKETRNYIRTLHHAINLYINGVANAEEWADNEDDIKVIKCQAMKVERLRIEDVADELYRGGKEGINLYIDRLNEPFTDDGIINNKIRCNEVIEKIYQNKDFALLKDGNLKDALQYLWLATLKASNELIKKVEEAKKLIKEPNKNPIIERALKDPILLDWFYDDAEELEKFIKFCLSAKNPTQRARRAGYLSKPKQNKIKKEYINTPLYEKLKELGIKVGGKSTWRGATN